MQLMINHLSVKREGQEHTEKHSELILLFIDYCRKFIHKKMNLNTNICYDDKRKIGI